MKNSGQAVINTDERFDEVVTANKIWTSEVGDWETEEKGKDEKLLQHFSHAKENYIQ